MGIVTAQVVYRPQEDDLQIVCWTDVQDTDIVLYRGSKASCQAWLDEVRIPDNETENNQTENLS